MSKKIYIAFAIVCVLGFAGQALASLTLDSTTVAGSGNVVVTSGGTTAATFSSPSGASATSNFLNITGTLPTVNSASARAVYISATSAGSSSSTQTAFGSDLLAGYSGSSATFGVRTTNSATGTNTGFWTTGSGNLGLFANSASVTTGHNIGVFGAAAFSSVLNVGVGARTVNTSALNIGVGSIALNATTNIAGFFGLMNSAPTLSTTSALIADNGAVAADIFEARDNGTPVFSITDGGNVNIGSNLTFSPTAPTVASGFGSSNTVEAGSTTTSWTVTVTTSGGATTGTLTLPAAAHRWTCWATDQTSNAKTTLQSGGSTTTAVLTTSSAWSDGDVIVGGCTAH